MTRETKPARLRELIAKGAIMLPGVPNAVMARQVERLGFDAVYISGAGMANATAGVPDIGLLTLTEVAQLAGYIARAVKIPAIVDADTGFGGSENVARTIRELEASGLAGCHIEDQEFPKRCGHLAGKSLIDIEEMTGRIKAAVAARRDPDFMIIARTAASVTTVPSGSVISQNPAAGTQGATGSAVALVVSSGPPQVAVPNVVGLTQAAATSAITGANLVVGTVTTASSTTVPSGSVISQNPTAGTQIAIGSAVALVVSSGAPGQILVPDVVGLTQAAATTAISNAGLVL